jgi:hypothetical protein
MVLLHPMNQALILVNYNLNHDYIVESFCINKAKPEMKCEGKCHLRKELKKNDEQQKEPKNLKEFSQLVFCFCHSDYNLDAAPAGKTLFHAGIDILHSPYLAGIFHPPAVFC